LPFSGNTIFKENTTKGIRSQQGSTEGYSIGFEIGNHNKTLINSTFLISKANINKTNMHIFTQKARLNFLVSFTMIYVLDKGPISINVMR
jgi:hypothetical protein